MRTDDEPIPGGLRPMERFSQLPALDLERLAVAGIRAIESKHLTLYTDLPPAEEIDELPHVFDLAIEPWCEYFGVDMRQVEGWRMRGSLMQRRERFLATGLLPGDLPPFLNGYARGDELWWYEQPSSYYRRHLLLHEGTHAFMQRFLHGMGPPWYMEGMAELMGTHRWEGGRLQLRYFPRSRDEVPQWGRIKMVREAFAEGRAMSLRQIAEYSSTAHLQNEPYGWCWAAAAFLDGHPQFAERFRRLPRRVADPPQEFDRLFQLQYRPDQRQLAEQWQLFVVELDYGYDLPREAFVYEPVGQEDGQTWVATVQANRGWQSTGLVVKAGTTYAVRAYGRYQLAGEPEIWWCEPNGVTLRYCRGYPLGMLLAGVSDQTRPLPAITPLARPTPVGAGGELTFSADGMLFLRVNDLPSELADNAGQVRVEIRELSRQP
jgi:hypothetical protein